MSHKSRMKCFEKVQSFAIIFKDKSTVVHFIKKFYHTKKIPIKFLQNSLLDTILDEEKGMKIILLK